MTWVVRVGERAAKDKLFDGLAMAGKALGNGRRAEIVDLLAQGERHVEEIAAEIDQSMANTSQHPSTCSGPVSSAAGGTACASTTG